MRRTEEIERKYKVRGWKTEAGSRKPEVGSWETKAPTGRNLTAQGEALCNDAPEGNALKGQIISARGNALGLYAPTTPIAPRSDEVQNNKFAWGKTNNMRMANNKRTNEIKTKENIQHSTFNIQYRSIKKLEVGSRKAEERCSFYFSAPTGRQVTAQGATLCNECNDSIAPRSIIVQGDEFAWGKINNKNKENIEYRSEEKKTEVERKSQFAERVSWFPNRDYKCAKCLPDGSQGTRTTRSAEKNRSLFATDVSLKRHAELVSVSQSTNTVAFGMRFRSRFSSGMFGMTAKENVEYRMMINEYRRWETKAPTGRQVAAQGEALCNESNDSIAPRSIIVQGDEFAWGKINNKNKENVEYRITNNECRSEEKRMEDRRPKTEVGRKSQFAERVSWFPNRDYKCAKCLPDGSQGIRTTRREKKNGSLFTADIYLERHPEFISGSHATTTEVFVDRFRVEPGMTDKITENMGKTSSLNNLTVLQFNNSPSRDKNIYLN